MKKTILSLACAMIASVAVAQTSVTTTKTTTSSGTVHEYSPGSSFVVKESSGPVKYKYGKKVKYVTKKGKTLTDDEVRTRIKVGSPVSVHYSTEGEDRVIDRVEIDDD
jgi:ligand-binding SRPBCC domain-containing protein